MKIKKILIILLAGLFLFTAVLAGCGEAKVIKVSELNWGSAQFQSAVAKILIEEGYGESVELVPGATIPLTQGLRSGDVDVMIEGWYQNQKEAIEAGLAAKEIEILGYLNDDNWQSAFVVPTYIVEENPGLKSVQDLAKPEFKELFANPENPSNGLILNGPPGWECEIVVPKQIEAYGLADDYDTLNAGSSDGLFASLKSAYDKKEPWIGYLWGPTWISGALDLTLLEEPAFTEELWADYACGWPSVDLFVASHMGFADDYPELATMFGKWEFDTATLAMVLSYMNESGSEPSETAVWFLKNHEDKWTKFVTDKAADKVKKAIADM
ncbi:MAG: hypothetical protein JSU79_11285 [Dehalococcoidales bacterium]|nr:MAG: hypothetical protein JSU79_11285 [Dehalococcoidales bacterium]